MFGAKRLKGSRNNKLPRNKGVTLLEVLVAMIVLTGGLFMVYNIFPKGFAASYRSKNQTIATQLAQGKLEEILQNKEPASCVGGTSCPYRFPQSISQEETGLTSDPFFTSGAKPCDTFYYNPGDYGVAGSNRLGTLCPFHMGVVDDLTTWVQFPESPWFWYHVQVVPVYDPSSNASGQTRLTLYRDFGSCSRVTVRVRGPIEDMTNWTTVMTAGGTRLPAEVVLSTYVANKFLASTQINVTDTNNYHALSITSPHGVCDDPSKLHWVKVNEGRNFTFFNTLKQEEKTPSWVFHINSAGDYPSGSELTSSAQRRPTGGSSGYGPRPIPPRFPSPMPYVYSQGPHYIGNNKSLDNVVIVRRDSVDGTFENGNDRLLIQTNKLISQAGAFGYGTTNFIFQQPLYYDQIPEHSMLKIIETDSPAEGLYQPPMPAPPVTQDNTLRRFGLFTNSNCNPTAGSYVWTAYQMDYNSTRAATPATPWVPPAPPNLGYSTVSSSRAIRYDVIQYVTIPRQSGANVEIY